MTTWSACSGRVGKINDRIYDRFNAESDASVDDIQLLGYHNEAIEDIAQAGYWQTYVTQDITAAEGEIDLMTEIPGIVEVKGVWWGITSSILTNQDNYVKPAATFDQLNYYRSQSAAGRITRYLVQANLLYLAPVPTSTITDALLIRYSYLPDELTCTVGEGETTDNPPFPAAFDKVLLYYSLWQLWDKDSTRSGSPKNADKYEGKYRAERARLLNQSIGGGGGYQVMPGRGI